MRTVTIRESAFKACKAIGYGGNELLMEALEIVFDGKDHDDDEFSDYKNAVLEAIVPDMKDSLRNEERFPPVSGIIGMIRSGIGLSGCDESDECSDEDVDIDVEDE